MLDRVSQEPEVISQLDANLAKQFAWLLREDLRNTFKTVDNPAFGDWWLIKGRQEYPAWAHATQVQELLPLFESAGKAIIAGVSLDVPKVVHQLARYRGDAVREYTRDGKLDNEKFFAWAMVVGLADHHLAAYAPRHILAMLDQTLPIALADPDAEGTVNSTPAPTLFMYLLWRLMDEPTQQARNIYTPEGRVAYMAWFFSVVGQLNIAPLIAGRWKSWVKSQPSYKGQQLAWASYAKNKTAPSSPSNKAEKPFGVNLYGFAYGELGIGEDLRMAVACCEAANIPYHVVNVDAGNIRQSDHLLKGKTHELHSKTFPIYRINIFCMPAFDTASRIFMQRGSRAFEGYYNIGWWPWELSAFPNAWKPYAFKLVDEVWASSVFLEKMYKLATKKPVTLMPLSVSVDRVVKHDRKYFNLPKNKFLYLYVFDFNSHLKRKNPESIINTFKYAFIKEDKKVGLVFKVMNAKLDTEEWKNFLNKCRSDERIYLITETLPREDLLALISICDAYVSLHRSEGFGRTMAEAMLFGKPVIATNYSGNKDFMHIDVTFPVDYTLVDVNKEDYFFVDVDDVVEWAEIDISSAIEMMKTVRKINNLEAYRQKTKMIANKIFSIKECSKKITKWIENNSIN
jgi:glycosyltransferase involved in cell wall biosynthesis